MEYIVLSVIIFCIGVAGILLRRNLIIILMSVELMLSASNISFVAFSKMHGNLDGQAVVLLLYVLAACEAAVGLAIIVGLFRLKGSVDIQLFRDLKK
ncbi:MAG: NADH-quinone oxidoreductase subunit NuoK [Deltaproteobacteria bacterium]|nr:NADH-quinone oxidoreductase subunit NuoK [Deltaproteobacteria bacterium]MBI2974054.1 NADH-quinone oxidoreductase subunit NuoK [Deltaproteobacteria bacterium]